MRSLRGKSFRLAGFSLIRVIFRAVFDPRSPFFAPKPHGHACYAGYVTREAFPVGRWSWRFCFVSTLTLYFLKLISLNRTRGAGSSTISQWIVNWERSMNGNLRKDQDCLVLPSCWMSVHSCFVMLVYTLINLSNLESLSPLLYYVAIATVIFLHVKMICSRFHVWRYHVFARKLTWYFMGVYIIKPNIFSFTKITFKGLTS